MKILITGGLGFIGINSTLFFSKENEVHIIDNLSRKGSVHNYNKVVNHPNVNIHIADIRNNDDVTTIFKKIKPDVILHLAGQVAVTTSVINPKEDFEINVVGTFNILEALRIHCPESLLIFSSTNKVYGDYKNNLTENETRYSYKDYSCVNEDVILDFHSPYGCSKGSADQYVRDYSRIFNLKTVVLRQSCIYGPNQFGIEDQGWVAWFTIAGVYNKKFYIYGDGKQVRDILHIDDLVLLYNMIINNVDKCNGKIYNVGGGTNNTLSLIELISLLENLTNKKLIYEFSDWRPGDQKIYISDINKIKSDIGWEPNIDVTNGVETLVNWVIDNNEILNNLKLN
jgi:CDP-paratose 2-epimerase